MFIFLIVLKYGFICLGKDDDEFDYSYMIWFVMLFSVGMGIGLVFWGVVELLNYLYVFLFGDSVIEESVCFVLCFLFFYWGLYFWGLYVFVVLCIVYFIFRKGKVSMISVIVGLLFKGGEYGCIVYLFDVLVVFVIVFGVVMLLGFGVK